MCVFSLGVRGSRGLERLAVLVHTHLVDLLLLGANQILDKLGNEATEALELGGDGRPVHVHGHLAAIGVEILGVLRSCLLDGGVEMAVENVGVAQGGVHASDVGVRAALARTILVEVQ